MLTLSSLLKCSARAYHISRHGQACHIYEWLQSHNGACSALFCARVLPRIARSAQEALGVFADIHAHFPLPGFRKQQHPPRNSHAYFQWGKAIFHAYIRYYSSTPPLPHAFAFGFEAGDWRASLGFLAFLEEHHKHIAPKAREEQAAALQRRLGNRITQLQSLLPFLPHVPYHSLYENMAKSRQPGATALCPHALIAEWEKIYQDVFLSEPFAL
ncbi:MAG: hypothetical protein KatS3mg033_2403 [Thermonema sp.]|uniref:hypothetical protein n=1 Tax=Thermonema sp. TaxID=2231181 RepID=UPI0021DB8CD8|nr:hypothetical protein [Thermonema sp.]GIV40603.1 MAG: hypothetical protein KatS3mg033_2403 [Thermonema sp.]